MRLIDAQGCAPQAIELLGAAVVDKSEPRLSARTYAQRRIDYLPYLQLARAHLACGNVQLARKYLDDSRRRDVADAAELDRLERRITELEQEQLQPEGPTVDEARLAARARQVGQRLDAAEAMLAQLEQRLGRPDPAEALQRAPGAAARIRAGLNGASESLRAARSRLATGRETSDPFAIADASTQAADLSRSLEDLDGDIDGAVATLQEERRAELERLEPARRTPTPRPIPTTVPTAPVTVPVPAATPPAPSMLPTPRTPGPLEALRAAARAYVGTDYQAVLERLAPATLEEAGVAGARQLGAAALLRAAARFALLRTRGWYGGDGGTTSSPGDAGAPGGATPADQAMQQALLADLAECHRLAPGLRPAPSIFPPPFLELVESSRP